MFQGIISLDHLRNETILNSYTQNNTIGTDLYNVISNALYTGNNFTQSVQTMVAHFSSNPQLPYAALSIGNGLGYKFNKPISSYVSNSESIFTQNVLFPLEETLSWKIRGLCMGRDFRSVSGDSVSSNYNYKQTTLYNIGQINTIYTYIKLKTPINVADGDQLRLTWRIILNLPQ